MSVLAHHDLRAMAVADQPNQVVSPDFVGLETQQSNAVEADIGSAVNDALMIRGVGVAAAMSDQAAMRRHTAVGKGLSAAPEVRRHPLRGISQWPTCTASSWRNTQG